MSINKNLQGNRGEEAAVSFLQKSGVRVIERNFRMRGGEIDIVGIDGDTLVFYEVKTRSSQQFGTPYEAIHYWKIKALTKAAQFYKLTHAGLPEALRIDAIAVMCTQNGEILSTDIVKNVLE